MHKKIRGKFEKKKFSGENLDILNLKRFARISLRLWLALNIYIFAEELNNWSLT